MNQLNVSSSPVDVLQMVRKHHTGCSVFDCDLHFERIALGLAGCRAQDAQPSFPIVALGTEDQRWTPTCLFVTRCGTERNPDPIASVGNIGDGFPIQSSTSRPTSAPKSVSPCNWEGLQFLSNSPKLSFFWIAGANHQFAVSNMQFNRCSFTNVPLPRERLRNADCQAITPFLYRRHGLLLKSCRYNEDTSLSPIDSRTLSMKSEPGCTR